MFGLQTDDGEQASRLVDIFWMWSNGPRMLLDGASVYAWIDRWPIVLAAATWIMLGWWIGKPFVDFARLPVSRLEACSVAALAGLALLSTSTFLLGIAGWIQSRWPLVTVLVAQALASFVVQRHFSPAAIPPPETTEATKGRLVFTAWGIRLVPVLCTALAVFYVLSCLLPAWEFDVLEYHLQAPKEFLQVGHIGFVPHNIYSNMPLATEMHALAIMLLIGGDTGWWWGGMVGKLVTGSHTLLAAMLVLGFTSRQFGSFIGWASASLLLATPACLHASSCGLVDMALGAYVVAAIWGSRLLSTPGSEHTVPLASRALLVFLLAGTAAACKYTGLVCGLIPVFVLVAIQLPRYLSEQGKSRSIGLAFASLLVALCLTVFPWYAKNAALVGNPVYPLAGSIFGYQEDDANDRWKAAHRPGGPTADAPFSPSELLNASKQITLASRFINPGLYFLAGCGVLLPLCWPFGVKPDIRRTILALAAISTWIVATWWLLTHRIDRFWFPMLPLLSLLAAAGMHRLIQLCNTGAVVAIALTGIAWGALVAASGGGPNDVRVFNPLSTFKANLTAPVENAIISPTIAWCNAQLYDSDKQPPRKLLLIGQAAAFQFQVPVVYSTCFDKSLAEELLRDKPLKEQIAGLTENGITHIAIDWVEIDRYRKPGSYGFSDWPTKHTPDAWVDSGLVRRLSAPFDDGEFEAFEVVQDAAASTTPPSE